MNQDVTEYIAKVKLDWQVELCNQLRQIIYQAIPDVDERIQYGKPHYRQNGKYICVLGTAKEWVSFTIFNASALEAPAGFFEASDVTDRKTIKIHKGQSVDEERVTKLLQQAASTL
jgi:hypothetical protein